MSISNLTNRISYTGDGATTAFTVPFPFHDAADLVVIETLISTGAQTAKVITTEYTISGTQDALGHYPNGGTVTAVTAPTSLYTWTIYRDVALTQSVDVTEGGALPVEAELEAPLDRLTLIEQRSRELSDRAIRQPDGDAVNISPMPAKASRLSKYLSFDASGEPIATAVDPPGGSFLTLPGVLLLTDYASLSAAVAAIGSSTITTLVVSASSTVAVNVTVTKNITLWFIGAGKLAIDSGITVTVEGLITSSAHQIFGGVGLLLLSGPQKTGYPEWWGAVGDGVADDAAALNAAWIGINGGILDIQAKYLCNSTFKLSSPNGGWLRGSVGGAAMAEIKAGGAIDLVLVDEKFRVRITGIFLNGDAGTGTNGLVCGDAGMDHFESLSIDNFSNAGVLFDITKATGGAGNNNFATFVKLNVTNNNIGFHVPAKQLDNNAIQLLHCRSASNTVHGVLYKGEGMRIWGGDYDANGGYGIQISESSDPSFSQSSMIFYPWLESNTLGGYRGGGKSVANFLFRDKNNQSLTNATGSEDIEQLINNSSGPILQLSDGDIQLALSVIIGSRAQIQATGAPTNVSLYLFGKGTGVIWLDPFDTGGVKIGSASTAILKHLSASAALDFPSTTTGLSADLTITVTGAALNDTVVLGVPNGSVLADSCYTAWVSAADTVTVRFNNYSAGTLDPASGTFRVDVWQH